ncbi:MAG: TlpA disulfide reductase family protein [Burkholderiaceae bacterium]
MSSPIKRRELLALGGCAALALAPPAAGAQALKRPWPRGKPTPQLSLSGIDGSGGGPGGGGAADWHLADAKGQVVLLNFWASWCEPCRSEMPSLELLAQRYEKDGLQIQAVNFRETDAAMRRFLQLMPITLPVLRDRDGTAARAFEVRVFPTTVVIGRDGQALFSVIGELDWTGPEARQWIAPLL